MDAFKTAFERWFDEVGVNLGSAKEDLEKAWDAGEREGYEAASDYSPDENL